MHESNTEKESELPMDENNMTTAVIVDGMHVIQRWSFLPGERFSDVEKRFRNNMFWQLPSNTTSLHFCVDRYDHQPSLKSIDRYRRYGKKTCKLYDVNDNLPAPTFRDFISSSDNKAKLLQFLSESWVAYSIEVLNYFTEIYL